MKDFPVQIVALVLAACLPCFGAELADGDMELTELGPWYTYGTPVTVEKSTRACRGMRSLRVVTDNLDTMGGNYEGTSRVLGKFAAGDRLTVSFWYNVASSRNLIVGVGTTYFMGRWVLSGTDWTRVDLSLRCPKDALYTIWFSQGGGATEFFLDDLELQVTRRPDLGECPAAERVALENGPLRLSFCRKTGALCGIENLGTNETVAPLGQRQPLFGIETLVGDGNRVGNVPFTEFRLVSLDVKGKNHAAFEFKAVAGEVTILVDVLLTLDGAAHFNGRIKNGSDDRILSIQLPVVQGICPAADPANLTLVHPDICGQIVKNAISSKGIRTTYPGRGVMGWLDLSGEKGGVYLATHGQKMTGTVLAAFPAPGPSFDLSLTTEIVVAPGEVLDIPETVLAVHHGDWHASADRYRTWARSWMQPPDVPDWLHRADGWVLMGVQNGIPFHRIPDVYRSAEWMGIDYLHVQGQGIDNMWFDESGTRQVHALSYLYPSPKFGTPEELRRAVADIHDRSGHVMFYYLYERWTPSHSESDNFGTGRRRDVPTAYRPPGLDFYYDNALVPRSGGVPPVEHPFMTHRIMCLGAPGWQEWMRRWAVDVYAKEYGADGFYWDVMGRNGPFRCFNERHGHHGQNNWAAGSARVLETVVREGRRLNPDYSCAIEGCSDVLGQWVGFHLMSGATRTPNVFRYTFPEYLCVDGFSNTTWKLTQPQKARRVFLDGERFDIHGYHQEVKKIIALRKRIKPFIDWPAVFKDTVGLTVSDPRVQARAFLRTDGDNRILAVTMINEEHVEGVTVNVDLTPIGRARTVHLFHFDGTTAEVQHSADGVQRIAVPADDISAAVIVNQASRDLAVVAWLEQIMSPGQDGLRLGLFFPDGSKPESLRLHANWPRGFTPRESTTRVSPCFEVRKFEDPDHLKGLRRWERTDVSLTCDGAEASVWTVLAPPLVNGDFEEVENGRLVYWGVPPSTGDPGQGEQCIQLDTTTGQGEQCIQLDTTTAPHKHISLLTPVKPNCRYRFRAMVKRSAAANGWAGAHIIEYEEGSKLVRSAALNSTRSGEWETLEIEFTTHPNPRSSAIYLYNFDPKKPAWFDGLSLSEIK